MQKSFNRIQMTLDYASMLDEIVSDLFSQFNFKVEIKDDDCFVVAGDCTIHWFEFCVVYITEAISQNFNTVYPKEKHEFIIDMMMKKLLNYSSLEKVHPI